MPTLLACNAIWAGPVCSANDNIISDLLIVRAEITATLNNLNFVCPYKCYLIIFSSVGTRANIDRSMQSPLVHLW